MKVCPNCGYACSDASVFCPTCGSALSAAPAAPQPAFTAPAPLESEPVHTNPVQPEPQPVYAEGPAPAGPSADHTAEFSAEEIKAARLPLLAGYGFGWLGYIVALLMLKGNAYADFHIRQMLQLEVAILLSVCLNIIPVLGTLAFWAAGGFLTVLRVIGFIHVCRGKAVEFPLLRKFGFLK